MNQVSPQSPFLEPNKDVDGANQNTPTYELASPAFFSDLHTLFPSLIPGTLYINSSGIWFNNSDGDEVIKFDISTVREIKQGYSRINIQTVEMHFYMFYIKRPFPACSHPFFVMYPHMVTFMPFFPLLNDWATNKSEQDQLRQAQWRNKFTEHGYPIRQWQFFRPKTYRRMVQGFVVYLVIFIFISLFCVTSSILLLPSTNHEPVKTTSITSPPTEDTSFRTTTPQSSSPPTHTKYEGNPLPASEYSISDKGSYTVRVTNSIFVNNGKSTKGVVYWFSIKNLSNKSTDYNITVRCTSDHGDSDENSSYVQDVSPDQTKSFGNYTYLDPKTQSANCSIVHVTS